MQCPVAVALLAATAVAVAGTPSAHLRLQRKGQATPPSNEGWHWPPGGLSMVQGGDGPNYFLLQRVGLQTDGALMPRSPLSPNARQCLTVIGQDDLSGNGLEMKPCQDPNIAADPTTKISNSLREAQKFSLEMDGRIRSKVTGLCIRRMDCDGRKMFDVGKCDTQQVATFVVKKAQMNHLDHLSQMGFPSSAVAAEQCEICGAYMLTYRCRGMMMPGGRSLCIKGFHSKPGWTNMPSQSIPGDMFDLTGRKTKAKGEELGNMEAAGEVAGSVQDVDMSGMGPSGRLCGSYVSDGPSLESFYFLVKTGQRGN